MLPRQLRIISKQSPLDLVGLAGCACKEAGSKWGWTLALDVPWAGSDRVHGGREQGVAQEELAALSGQRPWVVVSWPGGCFLEASIQPL